MARKPYVGVLLSSWVLRHALRGRAHESLSAYVRGARRAGCRLLIFSPPGLSWPGLEVRGYAPQGQRLVRVRAPLPRVVHCRLLGYRGFLRRLQRHGVRLYNPPLPRDKWRHVQCLLQDAAARAHLPPTAPLSGAGAAIQFLRQHRTVVLKPARGSLGRHVFRLARLGPGSYRLQSWRGEIRHMRGRELARWLSRLAGSRLYVMQRAIPLARYRGHPFDIRASVQRGAGGRWRVTGLVAKVAPRGCIVSNLARGGHAVPIEEALEDACRALPGSDPRELQQRLQAAALAVAQAFTACWPAAADLGLDLALDRQGRVWLLEVNLRDLRWSFRAAGRPRTYARQFERMIEYGAWLCRQGRDR